jgi:predicted phage terminase large subunit-like protein
MITAGRPKNYSQWRNWCDIVQNFTSNNIVQETPAQKAARLNNLRKDYAAFVMYYFPHYCTNHQTGALTSCASFHIAAAKHIIKNRTIKAVFKWARGHAKSTHMDIFIPMWLKCQKRKSINVMVLVGKSEENANALLADLQAELQYNQRYIADFGEQYSARQWTDGEFVTRDGCAFFARGRGQSPRGLRYRSNRPDYIVIDDLDDDELCENEKRVRKLTQWVKEALFGTMDGGRGRFIMVGNLISKNSVLANISKAKGVMLSQVNVYDRKGNVSWDSKWTKQEVEAMAEFMGYRSFQKEMMNNPITEGAVFKHDWIKWKKPLPLYKYDKIIAYCDPSFKSSSKNDYKAIKVWGKTGTELHNLYAFVRQCSVSEMVRWFYDLHERMGDKAICDYYIEANFLQDILLDEFEQEGNYRGYQLPIRADKRAKKDKFQRIESISPLWERGFVFYNEDMKNDPDMLAGLEQTLAFEKGTNSHDDAPDADEGAIYLLQYYVRQKNFNIRIGKRDSKINKFNW